MYDAQDEFDRSGGFLASLPMKMRPQALSSQGVATRHGAQRVALLKMQDKGGGMFGNMWEKVMLKLVEVKEKEGAKKKLQVITLVLFVPILLVRVLDFFHVLCTTCAFLLTKTAGSSGVRLLRKRQPQV